MILSLDRQIYTCIVCHSICIFLMYYSMVKPHCSNFRIITAISLGIQHFSDIYCTLFMSSFTTSNYCEQGVTPSSVIIYLHPPFLHCSLRRPISEVVFPREQRTASHLPPAPLLRLLVMAGKTLQRIRLH